MDESDFYNEIFKTHKAEFHGGMETPGPITGMSR